MKTFSEKVKDARLQLGLSQQQLGEATGVSLRTILSYEKGEKMPRQGTLLKLAKALKDKGLNLDSAFLEVPHRRSLRESHGGHREGQLY